VICVSASSTVTDLDEALDELFDRIEADLHGRRPDLLLAFFTEQHGARIDRLHTRLMETLDPRVLLGCPASGVIGEQHEHEGQTGLSLWAGHWPDCELLPFEVRPVDGEDEPTLLGWPDRAEAPPGASFLVLADPYTSPPEVLLRDFDQDFPGHTLVGGVSSASAGPGQGMLLTRDGVVQEGVVGVAIGGSVTVETVVSQGCRPIGKHFVITRADRNYIHALGGKPALSQLRQVFSDVDEADRLLMQSALHVGRVVDERKSRFETCDLLVRNVIGFRPEEQSIAISDYVRPGQTIQFMVRDAQAASADLATMLEPHRDQPPPLGALLFSCNGRGAEFFGTPDHDIGALHEQLGEVATAGFFAAGEIGPVGGRPFLHGLTASIALFRSKGR
jgi:small ligand-binding sensory domain FIST